MEVLAWRSSYTSAVTPVLEWFVATNYGIGHFMIRQVSTERAVFQSKFEARKFGWLNDGGLNAVRDTIWLKQMRRRAEERGGVINSIEAASIEVLNSEWHLGPLFQNDSKAKDVWSNLAGMPVGVSFEEIVAQAEQVVAEKREAALQQRAVAMAAIDPQWGIF